MTPTLSYRGGHARDGPRDWDLVGCTRCLRYFVAHCFFSDLARLPVHLDPRCSGLDARRRTGSLGASICMSLSAELGGVTHD